MSATMTTLTRHDITLPDSPWKASVILDDAGHGHALFSFGDNKGSQIDASELAPLIRLLSECEQVRSDMATLATMMTP